MLKILNKATAVTMRISSGLRYCDAIRIIVSAESELMHLNCASK